MALKGKSKKSSRHRAKPVARPPRAALEKRTPQRRRIDVFVVIGVLFVISMIVAVVWALVVSTRPEEVAGLEDYVTLSDDPRQELRNVSAELADTAGQIASAAPGADLTAAYERAGALAPRVQTAVATLAPQIETVGPEFRTAATLLAASGQVLAEGVSVLSTGQASDDPAMATQLARKAMRLSSASDTLRTAGERGLDDLRDGNTFTVQSGDVIPWAPPEDQQEGPPLNGILPEIPAPTGGEPRPVTQDAPIEVDLSTVPNARYAEVANSALVGLDSVAGNMGSVVSAAEAGADYASLQLEATKWYDAAATAFDTLAAGTGRPEEGAIDDVALLNSVWVLSESSRSFASAAVDPGQADALLASGRNLSLISDELRRAGTTGLASVEVLLPSPPETGFDPTSIGAAPPAGASPPAAGAPGGIPAPGIPTPGP